jgi:hypothetical protein
MCRKNKMSLTTNFNYLQASQFRIIVSRAHYPNTTYFAHSIAHPGFSVSATDVEYKDMTAPMPGTKVRWDTLSVNVMCDEDLTAYKELNDWTLRPICEKILSVSESARIKQEWPQRVDIRLQLLSNNNITLHEFKYVNAFPVSVGDLNFSAAQDPGMAITFPVKFEFTYFTVENN